MKKIMKRTAAVALTGLMTAGMLSGCGKDETLDGTAIVATVDGQEITMGQLSLRTRQVQAQITELYASYLGTTENIWNQEVDSETGETYGEQTVKDCLNQTELVYILKAKAADYGVEVTEEDQEKIATAAADFMAANTEETIAALAVTEQDVKDYLELETYSQRMYTAIIADVDTEVSDEEAQQTSFTYLNVDTTDLTEDDIAGKKEELQGIIDAVKADEETDLTAAASEVSEEYSVLNGTFTTNAWEDEASYPAEVCQALLEMKDGEICETVIETEMDGLYIVVLNQLFDEEETESQKETIISERENELYTTTTETWMEEAEITVDEKVLATLKLKDNLVFKYKALAESEIDEELVVDEEMEEVEIIEDEEELIDDSEIVDEEITEDTSSEDAVSEEEAFSEEEELVELTEEELAEMEELDAAEEDLEAEIE